MKITDLTDLKKLHDKAYAHCQVPREQAADDMVFYWVTQWDDNLLEQSELQYRGEFNILRKAGRQIISDLKSNPVQIDFQPKAESREDGADLLDGLYRADDRGNTTIEAHDQAKMEAVVCGVGAWVIHTEYETSRGGNTNQNITRHPIYEANNNVFWDPNAKLLDKSDARYVSVLIPYSEDGYAELHETLTGEEFTGRAPSFSNPDESYVFPWWGDDPWSYVVEFYNREEVNDKVLTVVDPFGEEMSLLESSLEKIMDELIDQGYEFVGEKKIKRWQVTKYIASGSDILSEEVIAGEHIPVIPCYGERAMIEGEEYWEGITRLAKDPQRLRNFVLSYLADIVSRSPRPKPIYYPEQIQGFEDMYNRTGADNNLPYLLQHMKDGNNNLLPLGAAGETPEQKVPQALLHIIEESRNAVDDVANAGVPQDIADPDSSGKAIYALQNRIDNQSQIYQENFKHAKRRDGEVYASMASSIQDVPRKVTIAKPDGTITTVEVMQVVMDKESGEPIVLNDITNMEFDVFAEIGSSFATQKQQDREETLAFIGILPEGDPLRDLAILEYAAMMDGVMFEDMRDYARKQLILRGYKEPETDEESAMVQAQAEKSQEPDASMILAQGEYMKGQAALLKEELAAQKAQADFQIDQKKVDVDAFEAATGRLLAKAKAAQIGVDIEGEQVTTYGKKLDNTQKIAGLVAPTAVMQ